MRAAAAFVVALACMGCAASRPNFREGTTSASSLITSDSSVRLTGDRARAIEFDRFRDIYVLRPSSLTKYSWFGDSLRAVSGFGSAHYEFNDPVDLDARYPNGVLVADRLNHRVEIYSRDLTYLATLFTRDDPDRNKRFGYPLAAAADQAANIFVLDGENRRVLKFRSDRTYERTFGGFSESSRPEGLLSDPRSLVVDDAGDVIVLDEGGRSLVTFDNFGTFIARTPLGTGCSRLAESSDTVFVLASHAPGGDSLLQFRAPDLTPAGIAARDVMRLSGAPVSDVAMHGASAVMLEDRYLLRFRRIPRFPTAK